MASNKANRLYMTAYPLDKGWVEDEVTWLQAAEGAPWAGAGASADYGDPMGWAWLDAPGWVEIELNPAALLDSEDGLLIRGEGTASRQVAYWFVSREAGSPALEPRLVLGYQE
jgi:hypothetical protein